MIHIFQIDGKGDPSVGLHPVLGTVVIEDNLIDDLTEEWRELIEDFYDEKGCVRTQKEYNDMRRSEDEKLERV